MVAQQHREPAHRVHRHRRLPPRHHHRHLGRPTAPPRSRRSIDPATRPGDLARPGHIFPLEAPRGRRAQAGRPHRGGGRPRPHWPGCYPAGVLCEIVNDDEDGHGPRARARASSADEHGLLMISIADLIRYRRQHREAGRARRRGPHPDRVGRVHLLRVRVGARRRAARRLRRGRGAGRGRRARAGAQRVPHRRRVRVAALRLRVAARRGDASDRRGGPRRGRVPARPRGPRHRHRPQDPRLQPAGPGPRHRRRQRRARPARRQPRVRHRRADPRRPRRHDDAADDQQPGQVRRPRRLRPRDRRAGAVETSNPENIVPAHQARADGPSARRAGPIGATTAGHDEPVLDGAGLRVGASSSPGSTTTSPCGCSTASGGAWPS